MQTVARKQKKKKKMLEIREEALPSPTLVPHLTPTRLDVQLVQF